MTNPYTRKTVDDVASKSEFLEAFKKPIWSERCLSATGERRTLIVYEGEHRLMKSADKVFADAKANPMILSFSISWHAIIPWLQNPPEQIEIFWKSFDTVESEQERFRAIRGTRFLNSFYELNTIELAKNVRQINLAIGAKDPPEGASPLGDIRNRLLDELGNWLVNVIHDDQEALLRLYRILKDENVVVDPKGDQLSLNGKFFVAFVQLVTKNCQLPTKKAVRKKAKFGDESKDLSTASLAFKTLGLGGLPTG